MKSKVAALLLALFLAFACGFAMAARMTSPGSQIIARDVLAGGGGSATIPDGHRIQTTAGQPVAGISQIPAGTVLVHGFHSPVPAGTTAARNWHLY